MRLKRDTQKVLKFNGKVRTEHGECTEKCLFIGENGKEVKYEIIFFKN